MNELLVFAGGTELSQATFSKYKSRYGGMEPSDAKKLRALEVGNSRLKASCGTDARQCDAQERERKRMVTPDAKRKAVEYLMGIHQVNQRCIA